MAFPVKRSKVAKRNETNERIKLFEHSQASSVCLSKSRLQQRFYGDISKLDNKMFFNFGYTMESHFLQIHEVKMGVTTLVLVQSWYNGMEKVNIHFKMHVSNVLSAR